MIGEASPTGRSGFPTSRLVVLGIILLLVSAGLLYALRDVVRPRSRPSYLTAPVTRADVATEVSATGPIVAAVSSPLTFKNAGMIASLAVKPGDRVTAGQVLATETTTDLQVALDQAKANYAQAEASLAALQTGPSDAQRVVARVAVGNAQAGAVDARNVAAAARDTADRDAAVAEAGVATANATVEAARQALASAQDQSATALAADRENIATAQRVLDAQRAASAASLTVLQHQLETAKDNLWSAQTTRDGVCGGSKGSPCVAANASVAAAQSAVDTADAQLDAGRKTSAQQVVQAQAQLRAAQALLATDTARWNATITGARSQLAQASAAATEARRASADAQAKATAAARTGQAQVDQADGTVAAARASYDQTVAPPTQAALDAAKAQVAAARAAAEAAQANLDAATLRAPFAGTVASVNAAVGMWVGAGASGSGGTTAPGVASTGLIQLMDLTQLEIVAQVNEADMARLRDGDQATFSVNALPGRTFTGQVSGIQPQGTSSQNVVLYNVTIAVDRGPRGTPAPLLPGMTASVHVATDRRTNVVVVPVTALAFAQSGGGPTNPAAPPSSSGATGGTPATVLVLVDGNPVTRSILVGLSNGRVAEVESGVSVGESVVTGVATADGRG